MRSTRLHRDRQTEQQELNVTAFMNLMVVLVPFLLIMAVFSRITIHELNLPKGEAQAAEQPPLQLEVVVRGDRLIVADPQQGLLRELPNVDGQYDLGTLRDLVLQLKSQAPTATQATVLLEPNVAYESLIGVMDALRFSAVRQDGELVQAELFPEISIGDAPLASREG